MASSIVPKMYGQSNRGNVLTIQCACTAHTDGTFTSTQITEAHIGFDYWNQGYFLAHAWALNDATTYPGSGAVTLADESGQLVLGAGSDTLSLATTASGIGYMTATRSTAQRPVVSKLTIAVSDTGDAANIFTLYIVFARYPT